MNIIDTEKKLFRQIEQLFRPTHQSQYRNIIDRLKKEFKLNNDCISALTGISRDKLLALSNNKTRHTILTKPEKRILWVVYNLFKKPHTILATYRIAYFLTWGATGDHEIYSDKTPQSFKRAITDIDLFKEQIPLIPETLMDFIQCDKLHAAAIIAASGYGKPSLYDNFIDI